MRIIFVYDETAPVPRAISRIIGAGRFGDLVRRKQRLADSIRAIVETNPVCDYVRLEDEAQLPELLDQLLKLPSDTQIFRLPSSIVPLASEIFEAIIAKLPYALSDVIYGESDGDDAPTLLSRDQSVNLLNQRDGDARRRFLRGLEATALRVSNQARFTDISEISAFLIFMSGATEARHFNSLSQTGAVFRKHSQDTVKMRGEYRFFHIADEEMKCFLQPTFGFAEEADGASYGMEYLSVPDAAMQIVHNTFTEVTFNRFMDCFFAFIDARGQKAIGAAEVRQVGQRDIVDKLDARITQLRATEAGQRLERWFEISGPYGTLDRMIE